MFKKFYLLVLMGLFLMVGCQKETIMPVNNTNSSYRGEGCDITDPNNEDEDEDDNGNITDPNNEDEDEDNDGDVSDARDPRNPKVELDGDDIDVITDPNNEDEEEDDDGK
jgi:hypothetical protein